MGSGSPELGGSAKDTGDGIARQERVLWAQRLRPRAGKAAWAEGRAINTLLPAS